MKDGVDSCKRNLRRRLAPERWIDATAGETWAIELTRAYDGLAGKLTRARDALVRHNQNGDAGAFAKLGVETDLSISSSIDEWFDAVDDRDRAIQEQVQGADPEKAAGRIAMLRMRLTWSHSLDAMARCPEPAVRSGEELTLLAHARVAAALVVARGIAEAMNLWPWYDQEVAAILRLLETEREPWRVAAKAAERRARKARPTVSWRTHRLEWQGDIDLGGWWIQRAKPKARSGRRSDREPIDDVDDL